ncbi:hypothetical protein ATC03_06565 [Agromyces aureus]|uniref:DUF3054 domain-containing protein n=1 Tax=Agromyces aureus TaxID=453304 RepID=A0A191WDT4_9MICO|nr:hypothetical protein ATC03_06565 [Agromyces aureus]
MRRPSDRGAVVLAAAIDVVLVVVFALIGRRSHAEALDLAGLWGTAWPFLVGAAVGWLVIRAWRAPLAVWPTGVVIWIASVLVGMLLRAASGQGTAVAFIVVATLTLALLLLGWRAIALLVLRLRRRSASAAASGAAPVETPAS